MNFWNIKKECLMYSLWDHSNGVENNAFMQRWNIWRKKRYLDWSFEFIIAASYVI